MFVFTWIDSNMRKNDLTIKDPVGALRFYGVLNRYGNAHGLKVMYKTEEVEAQVVFVNGKVIAVT